MCTVTWLYQADGYHLFFNRDERLTRRPAFAPVLERSAEMVYLSPRDGDYGGTWIAVNEAGVSFCLLNRQDRSGTGAAQKLRSRGEIILKLISADQLTDLDRLLTELPLTEYAPFTLAAFTPGGESRRVQWRGDDLEIIQCRTERGMITSSSYATADVVAAREGAYRSLIGEKPDVNAEDLRQFHASHDPISGARSVCLHRDDAVTVSLTHIEVTGSLIQFCYHSSSPCTISSDRVTETVLPRRF